MDSKQMRFCLSIRCTELKGRECGLKECKHPDKDQAIAERRQEVAHGG